MHAMDYVHGLLTAPQLSLASITLRLFVTLLIAGAIGIERERHQQPAGLRTHIIISIGSTLLMVLSISVAQQYGEVRGDAGRIAAQVVSGIGFLGAGAILKFGADIRGLTTAASIWTVAAIGLAVGAGLYTAAAVAAAFILFALIILDQVTDRWFPKHVIKELEIHTRSPEIQTREIGAILSEAGIRIRSLNIEHAVQEGATRFCYVVHMPRSFSYRRLYERLETLKDVCKIIIGERSV